MRAIAVVVGALAFAGPGCGSGGDDGDVVVDAGALAQDGAGATGDTGGTADPGGTDAAAPAGDTGGTNPSLAQKCGTKGRTGAAIGEPCTDHSECETGYCYDEYLWNEDGSKTYRFCTVACTGCTVKKNCNEWTKAAGVAENKCFPFTSSFINFYRLSPDYQEMVFDSVCLPACNDDGNCAALGPLSKCAKLSFGKEYDYGVAKICQPPSYPELPDERF